MKLSHFSATLTLFTSISALADNYKFCYETWIPYADKDASGKPVGSTIEFITATMKALGHTAQFEMIGSPDRCTAEVNAGNYAGQLFQAPAAFAGWHDTITTEYWLIAPIVTTTSSITKYDGIASLKGKRVGIVQGYPYPDSLEGFKGMTVEKVTDSKLNLKKLSAGRVDILFEDPTWVALEGKRENITNLKQIQPMIAKDPTNLTFGPKHKDIAAKFTAKGNELIKSGELDKLYEKFAGMSFKAFKAKYDIK